MKSVPLSASLRTVTGRIDVKKLRATGRVPAVIYGRQLQPQNLEINLKELDTLLHHSASENVLVDLAVTGDARPQRLALVQEVQHHPISRKVIHVDFHEVKPDEKVTLNVPVETTGESVGVKNGGILEHVRFKLKVRALPKDLPEALYVDVSTLDIGKTIHIGEIKAPEGVELLGDKNVPVLAVVAPLTEEQEAAAAATTAAPGEVEMIKEKKAEGEEGAAAPAAGAKDAKAEKAPDKAAAPAKDAKAEKKK